MKNLWNSLKAKQYIAKYSKKGIKEDLALRIYTTHLLGGEKKLVLHGGGNTSVKSFQKDIFNKKRNVIFVKGSGWEMSNLNHIGMPGLYLDSLLKTIILNKMDDESMVNYLRSNLLNSNSPNPSVETLLHAFLPYKYVDHTHSNAILSIVNLKESFSLIKKIFGNKLGIVPYVMPGFHLAKTCLQIYQKQKNIEGLILLNHGIFTFGETAKESYDRMIKFVTIAERYINKNKKNVPKFHLKNLGLSNKLPVTCRKIFHKISKNKWIINFNTKKEDREFTLRKNIHLLFNKGPVTPDHVIRIKSKPLIISQNDLKKIELNSNFFEKLIKSYCNNYKKYFLNFKKEVKNSKISDPLPRIIIIAGKGFFSIGRNIKEEKISKDIFNSMKQTIIDSSSLGNFKSINNKEIFKMEYWPLERAKLNTKTRNLLEGNIALITGGMGTIGLATAKKFLQEGLAVILLDKFFNGKGEIHKNILDKCLCIKCDLTSNIQIDRAINEVIYQLGGIDILISNAGNVFQGSMENVTDRIIKDSMDINFYSHHKITQKIINIMKMQNFGGSIMFNLSKQAVNPGKNFGPYGIAKSSALFLMKQYALEFGKYNIRVNGINADRIQSGILTKKLIQQRSKARNISPKKYLKNNLLNQEVLAEDVAEAFFTQIFLKKTTGNIITVDGGNIEASLR